MAQLSTTQRERIAAGSFGVFVVGCLLYAFLVMQLLLGIVAIAIATTLYVPYRSGKLAQVPAISIGWGVAIFGYLSTDGRSGLLSLLLGVTVYIAVNLYQQSDA